MKIKMKGVVLSCCLATACAGNQAGHMAQDEPKQLESQNEMVLSDGVYSVRQIAETSAEIVDVDEDEIVVKYDSEDYSEYLLIGKVPDLTFDLKEPATKIQLDKDNFFISIKFEKDAADKLAVLTKDLAEIGGYAANVIGGKVVSYHKIREEIPGGELRVSCCDMSACDRLIEALEIKGR